MSSPRTIGPLWAALLAAAAASSALGFTLSGNIYTTDGSFGDVSAAVGGAPAGTIVEIPAGTFNWGAGGGRMYIPDGCTLEGAGTGATTITIDATGPTGQSAVINLYSAGTVRNFSIIGSSGSVPVFSAQNVSGWRITNIVYTPSGTVGNYFCLVNGVYGIIDSCTLTGASGTNELIFIRGMSTSWTTPDSESTANNLFIEDCVFHGTGYVCDANSEARAVIRGCTITGDMKVDAHGLASNGNPAEGVRHMEIYNNTWTMNGHMSAGALDLRGGTGYVFNNQSVNNPASVANFFLDEYGVTGGPWPNFGNVAQTPYNYPVGYQIGTGEAQTEAAAAITAWQMVKIFSAGTSDFTAVGAASNAPAVQFIATGPATGSGTVSYVPAGDPMYLWNNLAAAAAGAGAATVDWAFTWKPPTAAALAEYRLQTGNPSAAFTLGPTAPCVIHQNQDYFKQNVGSPFDGSGSGGNGVGVGTTAQMNALRPTLAGVGFWVTDQGSWNTTLPANTSGQLYVWNGTAWILRYTPYTYPNPLRAQSGAATTGNPTTPTVSVTGAAIAAGGTVVFSVPSQSGATYQWNYYGSAIPGATGASYTLAGAGGYQSGAYSVTVTENGSSVTASAVTITVSENARLVNLSARGYAGSAPALGLTVGCVVGGNGTKDVLVRGVGPALGAFGVTGALSAATLSVFDASESLVATDAGWGNALTPGTSTAISARPAGASIMAAVGAFALPAGSADSALLVSAPVGALTANVSGTAGTSGIALAEIYDTDSATQNNLSAGAVLANLSASSQVASNGQVLIAGFVIEGTTSQTVLLRAVGPGLAQFGLSGVLAEPRLTLYSTAAALSGYTPAVIAQDVGWANSVTRGSAQVTAGVQGATGALMSRVNAFALASGSADSALIATLPPGAYTAEVDGADGGGGLALVEIYDLR